MGGGVVMDRTAATVWLERIVSTATPPTLTPEDVDAALDAARVVDAYGRGPLADGYAETINTYYAAALLFDLKATLAAAGDTGGLSSFSSEGSSFTMRDGTGADGFAALAAKYRAVAFPSSGLEAIPIRSVYDLHARSSFDLDTTYVER